MLEIHYGVVQIEGEWFIIGEGLRTGPYPSQDEAEQVARRLAEKAAGLEVQLHVQDISGELRRQPHSDEC